MRSQVMLTMFIILDTGFLVSWFSQYDVYMYYYVTSYYEAVNILNVLVWYSWVYFLL